MVEQKRWLQPSSGKVIFNDQPTGPYEPAMGSGWVPVVMIPTQGDMPAECPSTLYDIFEWLTDTQKYDIYDLDIDDNDGVDKLTIKGSVKTIEVLTDILTPISYFDVDVGDVDADDLVVFYNPDATTPITTLEIQERIDERIAARIADNKKDLGEGQPPKEGNNEAPDLEDMLEDMIDAAEMQEQLKEQLEKRGQVQSEHDKPTDLTDEAKREIQKHKQGQQQRQQTCFMEGTLVETPNGPQDISTLTVGDPIYAFEDGKLVVVDVEKCYVGQADAFHTVTFDNGSQFKVTSEHPVYVRINEEWTWMAVRELSSGDDVMVLNMDESLTIGAVISNYYHESEYSVEVYNLEVEDPHTYFAEGILVHNKDPQPGPPQPMPGPPTPETPEDRARRRAMERMEEIQNEVEKAKREAQDAAKQAENMPTDQQEPADVNGSSQTTGPEGTPQPDSQGEGGEGSEDQTEGDGGADGAGQSQGGGDGDGDDDGNCQNCGPDDNDTDDDGKGGHAFGIFDKAAGGFL